MLSFIYIYIPVVILFYNIYLTVKICEIIMSITVSASNITVKTKPTTLYKIVMLY